MPFALYRLIEYSMTQFTDFITNAAQEATGIMGEPISINGQTVQAVFDEQTNSWEMNEFGTDDQPTVTLVIALASLNIIPNKAQTFVRTATGETFFITEVSLEEKSADCFRRLRDVITATNIT